MIEDKSATTEEPGAAEDEVEDNAEGQADDERDEKAPPRPTYLFLIRHGENEWTERGALAGRTPSVPLNEKGKEQAQQIAERLKDQPISAVYSSPLLRCLETAQPLAAALDLSVSVEPGILEVDYGEWRGGELKELSKRPEWRLVQVFPGGFRFPGGETLREVQNRVITTLERIRTEHTGEVVAVFAHGDVLRTSLAYYLGTPLDLFQRIQISTASISLVVFHRFGPSILAMNDSGGFSVIKLERDT
ncbi:MAG: MSMEG_4193 family putative phosphomutase [Caldilineaceae bacterium]|nr:MSMEG_4193 family putative phosphomutase [Caldilineaceae bacterium]